MAGCGTLGVFPLIVDDKVAVSLWGTRRRVITITLDGDLEVKGDDRSNVVRPLDAVRVTSD